MASLTSVCTSVSQAQRRASFQRTMMGVGVALGGIWLGVITDLYLASAVDTLMSTAILGAHPAVSTVVALALLTLLGVVAHLTRKPWLRGDYLLSILGSGSASVVALAERLVGRI